MKHFCLLLGIILSFNAIGQNHKVRLGICLNPLLSDNFLSNDGTVPDYVSDIYKKDEKRRFGYSALLFAQFDLSQRCKLQTGIGYSRTGFGTFKHGLIFEVPEPNAPQSVKFDFIHDDLLIPIQLRYNLSKKKSTFYLTGGLNPLVKLKRTKIQTTWYADGSSVRHKTQDQGTDYRHFNINMSMGFGYDLRLGEKTNLFFQPNFTYTMFGVSSSASLNRRMYTAGIGIGLMFG